jgi:predicted RNase H-like HicB family nuclease
MVKYTIIIEKAGENYSAYCPDVPGCVAAAGTVDGVIELMKEAIKGHLELIKEDEMEIPEPTTQAASVEVTV